MPTNAGLARHGARQQRLPGARCAGEQHAARDAGAEAPVALRVLEEVDHLRQLVLGLLDPRDVLEADALRGRLDAARAAAAELADAPAAGCSTEEPDEQPDEQDRRAEAEQDRLEQRALAGRLGADDHVVLLEQLGELLVVREGGELGLELLGRLVLVGEVLLELALHGVPAGRDLLDVPRPHLVEEGRVVRDLDALLRRRHDGDDHPVQDEQPDQDQYEPARVPRDHRRLLRRAAHAQVLSLGISRRWRGAGVGRASLIGHTPMLRGQPRNFLPRPGFQRTMLSVRLRAGLALIAAACLGAAAAPANAATYCAPADPAADGCDGGDFGTIQEALDAAAAHAGPDIVFIRTGLPNKLAADTST
jgi:hypothetical protein